MKVKSLQSIFLFTIEVIIVIDIAKTKPNEIFSPIYGIRIDEKIAVWR